MAKAKAAKGKPAKAAPQEVLLERHPGERALRVLLHPLDHAPGRSVEPRHQRLYRLAAERAHIRYVPGLADPERLIATVVKTGFTATGTPISSAAFHASSGSVTGRPRGTGTPTAANRPLVRSLSCAIDSATALVESTSAACMRRWRGQPRPGRSRADR